MGEKALLLLRRKRSRLHGDLDTALATGVAALGQAGQDVGDVVPGVAVETCAQALLVEEMSNETDGAAQHEQAVENTHAEVVFGFFGAKGTRVAEQVDEADGDAAVDVEDQVVLLGCRDGLDRDGIVEEFAAGEVLLDVLLDQLDT